MYCGKNNSRPVNVRHIILLLLLVLILCLLTACSLTGTEENDEGSADSTVVSDSAHKRESHSSQNEDDKEAEEDIEEDEYEEEEEEEKEEEENKDEYISTASDLSLQQDANDNPSSEEVGGEIEELWYQTYTYFEDEDGNYYRVSYEDSEENHTRLYVTSYGKDTEREYFTAGAEDYAETTDGGYKYYDTGYNNSVLTFYPETAELVLMESEYVTDYCTPAEEMSIADPHGFATGGTWWDTTSQRCNMKIEYIQNASTGECRYKITIAWSNGAENSSTWEIKQGTYNEDQNAIVFSDCRYYTTTSYADGTMMDKDIYTDGTGSIVMDEDNRLYWNDDVEDTGTNCVFENEYYDYTVEPYYAASLSEVTDDILSSMRTYAENFFYVNVDNTWGSAEHLNGMNYLGCYFMAAKSNSASYENIIYMIYSIDVTTAGESFSYYLFLRFTNILCKSDGSCSVDLSTCSMPTNTYYPSMFSGSYYYNGYRTLNELYSDCVTSNMDMYNYESTVG